MDDKEKTKPQLLDDLVELRRRIAVLEMAEAERKRTEQELRNEKALLDALMDNIPDSIYFKDRQCRLVRINRKEMRDLNLNDMSQVIGKTDVDLFGEEFGRKTLADDQRLMESGKPIIGLVESRQLENGQINWTSTTKVPLPDASGQIVGLVGITREINELMKAQEALRESEEKFRFVFENAYDGMSIFEETLDPNQRRLVQCNARYAEMSGRSREELLDIGITWNLAKSLSEDNRQSRERGVVFGGSFTWIRPDGKDNVIEYIAVPMKIREKTYTIGIDRDVTERKRAEAEREKLITQLQGALADVKMLSGLVPICANCKKIRDDKGYWTQVEAYIQERSEARFSHGICPDCTKTLYPDYHPEGSK
jgi:PAS domain S-box-containing protein